MRCGLPFPATVWRVATGWGEGTKRLRTAGAAGGDGKGPRAAEAVAVVRRSGRGEVTRGTTGRRDETRRGRQFVYGVFFSAHSRAQWTEENGSFTCTAAQTKPDPTVFLPLLSS